MQASKWLYTAPVQPDSLAWSQDDLLAVAAGPAVVLVNPFDMQGPRSYINFSARGDATASHPQCTPEEPDSSLKYALSCMRTERVKEFSWAPHVKSIAWSPPGCGPDGICLLATVLSDHQVFICSPFADRSSAEWNPVVRITDQFRHQTQHSISKGKPNGKARSKRGRTKAALRLKGGGTTEEFVQPLLDPTSLFVEGADVEVPEKKPSLSQKWYKGVLRKSDSGFGFIEYTPRDDKGRLMNKIGEWLRLPGISFVTEGISSQMTTSQANQGASIRPARQQNESPISMDSCLNGKIVEVDEGDCWVIALVHNAEVTSTSLGVEISGCARIKRVNQSSVRWPETWSLQGWSPADQAKLKFTSCIGSGNNNSITPAGDSKKRSRPEQTAKRVSNTRTRGRCRGIVGTRQNPRIIPSRELPESNSREMRLACIEDNDLEQNPVGIDSDGRGSGGRSGKWITPKRGRRTGSGRKKGEVGVSSRGGGRGACRGRGTRDRGEKGTVKKRGGGRGRGRGRGARSVRAFPQTSDEESIGSEGKALTSREQWVSGDQPYVVPDDFDAAVFGGELQRETSRKMVLDAAKRGLHRWITLRSEIPEENLPEYSHSVRLQGEDLRLCNQVLAELLKTFGTEMEAMGITIKELVKELKKSIRRRGICSHNVYFRADRPHLTRHHSLLPMIGQKPASMTGSKRKRDFDEGPDSMLIPSVDTHGLDSLTFPPQALTAARYEWSSCRRRGLNIVSTNHACLNWSASVENFVSRRNKTRPKVPINPLMSGVPVPKAEYETRASLSAAKCVAWSPVAKNGESTFVVLAVGTESGHIVFWRIACDSPLTGASKQTPCMLGFANVHRREVSVLKWQELRVSKDQTEVILISGSVEGDIRLSELDLGEVSEIQINSNGILESACKPWGWICETDMQPVTCLSVGIEQQWDGDRLVVAAGKSGGTIAIWRSPLLRDYLESADAESWLVNGERVKIPQAHKAFCITGIACCLVDGLVASTGMDCSVKCWRNVGGTYVEVENPKSIDEDNGNTCVPYGMAQSQNGLLLAVLKDQGLKQLESQTHKMSWKKVAHAKIVLMKIMGGATMYRKSLSEGFMATRVLARMKSVSDIAASFLFDSPGALSSLTTEAFDHTTSKSMPDERDLDRDFPNPVPAQVNNHETMHQVVLDMLEDDAGEFMNLCLGEEPPNMWSRLQLAVAFRRMLKGCSEQYSGKERIDLLEFYLLQKHVYTITTERDARSESLSNHTSSIITDGNRIMVALMVKWVLEHKNSSSMHPQLVEIAAKACTEGAGGVEDDPFSHGELRFGTGSPVEVVQIAVSSGSDLILHRCSSTLLTCCEVAFEWSCPLCIRKYFISPEKLLDIGLPHSCLYCGTKLARERGAGFSLVPGAFVGLKK